MAQLKNTVISGTLEVTETSSFQDVIVKSNLYVNGISSCVQDLKIVDKDIELGISASTPAAIDGAGVHFGKDLGLFFTYSAAQDDFEFSKPISGVVPNTLFNAYTASTSASFGGTASYATTASFANNVENRFLPLAGGTITGSLSINGKLSQGSINQGQDVTASGLYSHAQGGGSEARGNYSHAEGKEAASIGDYSHAEGYNSRTQGQYSHAEGCNTIAVGAYSHAGGLSTSASIDYQTVFGILNLPDTGSQYSFIIGCGQEITPPSQSEEPADTRANAFAVRWSGDIDMNPNSVLYGTASYALTAENVVAISASFAATIDNILARLTAAGI